MDAFNAKSSARKARIKSLSYKGKGKHNSVVQKSSHGQTSERYAIVAMFVKGVSSYCKQ